jgi:uncharacterized protein YgiM (DUF1202 family)
MDAKALVDSVGLNSTMDRRQVVKLISGASALAVVGAVGLAGRAGAQEAAAVGDYYRTTARLNLREKPSTSAPVITVLPLNALVQQVAPMQNGFRKVAYQGKNGWAHADFLEISNGGSSDPPNFIGQGVTTTAVNFRSGPSTGHKIYGVLSKGTVLDISDRVEYGFRYVKYNEQGGYVYDDYIAPYGGEDDGAVHFITTARVNLRAKPSKSAKVLMVVNAGEEVLDYDLELANGYRSVDYKGSVGWIYNAYLDEK